MCLSYFYTHELNSAFEYLVCVRCVYSLGHWVLIGEGMEFCFCFVVCWRVFMCTCDLCMHEQRPGINSRCLLSVSTLFLKQGISTWTSLLSEASLCDPCLLCRALDYWCAPQHPQPPFTWVVEIWTWFLCLTQQALCQLSHLCSPRNYFLFFRLYVCLYTT